MHLQITAKTKKWLNAVTTSFEHRNNIYAWHVNITTIKRKQFIVLMHDVTKFCIVLYGAYVKEMKDKAFLNTMVYLALKVQGYDEDLIINYLEGNKEEVLFHNTTSRKILGLLNRQTDFALSVAFDRGINFRDPCQLHISEVINEGIVDIMNKDGYTVPKEKMATLLASLMYS